MSCTANLVSYVDSNWVASDLPIKYALTNDKWPINNTDMEDSFTSVADDNGYSRITLSSTYESYAKGSYITISDSSVAALNGVWRIRTVYSSTDITIEAPYVATATGYIQRYYNNYHIVVRVYTGIRSGHTYESKRPMALRGTIQIRPEADNTARANIQSFVRKDLAPIDNHFCELDFEDGSANDWNQWTQFYVEFAESYDVAVDGILETYTSDFVRDEDSSGNINIFSAAKSANRFQYAQGRSMAEYSLNPDNYDGTGKFMTHFEKPTYFEGYEWDLSIINDYKNSEIGPAHQIYINETAADGTLLGTTIYDMAEQDEGVYRIDLGHHTFFASCDTFTIFIRYDQNGNDYNSQALTVRYQNRCVVDNPVYLRWLNQLGGWDGWLFIRNKDYILDVTERTSVTRDIYSDWDNTFTSGTTQDDYIYTKAVERRIVRSQLLSQDEAKRLGMELKYSNKVQEIYQSDDTNCGNDERRTVLIEPGTTTYLSDGTKIREVEIAFRYTDNIIIPGQ